MPKGARGAAVLAHPQSFPTIFESRSERWFRVALAGAVGCPAEVLAGDTPLLPYGLTIANALLPLSEPIT
jgi:hypothetical protein